MADLDEARTRAVLKIMVDEYTIRQDPTSRRYLFCSGGLNVSDYERVLQTHLAEIVLTEDDIQ